MRRYGRAHKPLENMRFNIQSVLAGAYRGKDISQRGLLIHVAVLDEKGYVKGPLCKSVKPDSLTGDDRPLEELSCPKCKERLPGFILRGAIYTPWSSSE
jgi:hypothetical protein